MLQSQFWRSVDQGGGLSDGVGSKERAYPEPTDKVNKASSAPPETPEEVEQRRQAERQLEAGRQRQEVIDAYSWGKILIISAYSEQERILKEKLSEIPHAELPPDLWSITTFNESPSHQAEIIICDLMRTENPGFLTADERLAVTTTRAQALTVPCPEIAKQLVQDLTLFKNIPPMGDITRHAFSSVKSGRLPDPIKRVKESQKEGRETSVVNVHNTYFKTIKANSPRYCIFRSEPFESRLTDVRHGQAYISNSIRTSRYTVWDFLPKQLFFQFSGIGNFYFLCVGIP
ncbi:hypothetical protein MKX08_003429 [Trichoderma sp. CBMAI-0020]|nr:hypothetical protein MKX08_003429 [Trichoderma sp. CBMAI-0020]